MFNYQNSLIIHWVTNQFIRIEIKYAEWHFDLKWESRLFLAVAWGDFWQEQFLTLPGFWMTELQALAISSLLASSGYWFSMKKLQERNTHSIGNS